MHDGQALQCGTSHNFGSDFAKAFDVQFLDKDNQVIVEAFSARIAEEEERLAEMKRIRMSYQTEMNEMNHKLESMRAFITETMEAYDPADEFGVDRETYRGMIGKVDEYFSARTGGIENPDDEYFYDDESGEEPRAFLNSPEYETVYEKHGWGNVKDYFDEFSELKDGGEYALIFSLVPGKAAGAAGAAFANVMLGLLIRENSDKRLTLGCNVKDNSEDGQNHFWLLMKK